MKNNKFCTSNAFSFSACTNKTLNFLLRHCFEDVNTGTNSISSLSPNLGAVPKTPQGSSLIFAILRELKQREKLDKKKRAIILIAREVCVVLSVVVAKAPYIREIDSSILVYPNSYEKRRKSIRIHWTNCLHYKTLPIYKASHLL